MPRWPRVDRRGELSAGDVFTAHSRAFPAMAYLWSYLTIDWDRVSGFIPRGRDLIYNQLQQLRPVLWRGPNASSTISETATIVSIHCLFRNRKETLGTDRRGTEHARTGPQLRLGHEGGKRTAGKF